MDYRDAGVDIEAGREFVERIRRDVASTQRPEVLGGLGGFAGCCQIPSGYREPILVAGTDGVGTKLLLAQALNRHDTIGIDLVAMCVNDVLTTGAEPLFFLDYLATGHLDPAALAAVISGIAEACRQSGCALLGGETAEMPGFYAHQQYDLAGFCVGVVEREQRLDGSQVQVGDAILGLASQGVHSNGFSLVRRIVAQAGAAWTDCPPELAGVSLGHALLAPTQLYVAAVLGARQAGIELHGLAHITGGGLPENLPRALGAGQAAQLDPQSWPCPPVFGWLATQGSVPPAAMFATFNMGIGFAAIVPPAQVEAGLHWFQMQNLNAYQIGEVVAGDRTVLGLPR
ncbi:MAG: phosphoribosylformylglycinamidine cyclo-ligase [Spirulinaceae cyanobacterium SM2_1_0]|nr:phosphoribosylformylglycinamidine cyclo-ligase [Spirulinaceae cyanobacterium SM2_1_0]